MAVQFIESGEFVWNAGIFIWNVVAFKEALKKCMPDTYDLFEEGNEFYYSDSEPAFLNKAYARCKSVSVDKGIMEKADNVYVILSDFGWSDLGTWKSLYEVSEKDEHQNVATGKLLMYDTENCIIKTPEDKLVVINGLNGFIVAEYDNVLLICKKEDEQKVKDFVADAKFIDPRFV